MQLNISGHHIELTDALKDYVASKLEKLERHSDQITRTEVILKVDKQRQIAEATIHVTGGDINAKAEHDDMYAAIDQMVDKLDRQLLKHKEKQVERMHGAAAR